MLAVAGKDCRIRIYDEATKSLTMTMKMLGENPGHSNRIFSVKFSPYNPNLLVSGGWDNTLQLNDLRE